MALTKKQIANRKKLIDTLRSGKYKQGKDTLNRKDGSGFCCQGVACDIFKDEVRGKWNKESSVANLLGTTFISKTPTGGDSLDASSWPEVIRHDILGIGFEDSNALIKMNDGRSFSPITDRALRTYTLGEQCTFEEIADCLEFMTLAES